MSDAGRAAGGPPGTGSSLSPDERAETDQAAGAFLTGPSVSAVKSRKAISSGLGWVRQTGEHAGVRTGPVGTCTYVHRKGLRICAVSATAAHP
jgi:hypothetical protein